jgi:hypothetical protein
MNRQQRAILGGILAGAGLGIALALILNIALTQLTVNWQPPTPFPSKGLATFLSLLAGLGVGLGRGIMVASLTREDASLTSQDASATSGDVSPSSS